MDDLKVVRTKVAELFDRHIGLKAFSEKLEDNLYDFHFEDINTDIDAQLALLEPGATDGYRRHARGIVANFKRNTRLADDFAAGLIPPRWIVHRPQEAFASAAQKNEKACHRMEAIRNSLLDDESAAVLARSKGAKNALVISNVDGRPTFREPAPGENQTC